MMTSSIDPADLADDPVLAAFAAAFDVVLDLDAGEAHDPVHAHALITRAADVLETAASDPTLPLDEAAASLSLARRVHALHAAIDRADHHDRTGAWTALRNAMFGTTAQ